MSHITTIETKVRDLGALAAACRELGVELRLNQKQFRTYAGNLDKCEAAIVIPGNSKAYEAGIVRAPDGDGYLIQVDDYAGGKGLADKIGLGAKKLSQYYGIHAAESVAKKQGMAVKRQTLADGSIRLVCEPKQQFATAAAGGGWGGSGF